MPGNPNAANHRHTPAKGYIINALLYNPTSSKRTAVAVKEKPQIYARYINAAFDSSQSKLQRLGYLAVLASCKELPEYLPVNERQRVNRPLNVGRKARIVAKQAVFHSTTCRQYITRILHSFHCLLPSALVNK